ncbi:MAG: TPM domain-containing protein [Gemmatimonadetes bacterium]|nr:TPM domain-containing protein [Gemmatimonadota bacterium]
MLLASGVPPAAAEVPVPPAPARFLHDGASLLDRTETRQVEKRLMELNEERGLQIGVATLRSLDGDAIETVSMRIAESWRPGFRERDNGALIVIAAADRKIRIEIGYGLESVIPDAAAGRIIRHRMAPQFRNGRWGDGILA